MFVTATDGWIVRSLTDYGYPVFIVRHGEKVVGVAGGTDGLEGLLRDFITDFEKSPQKKLPVLSVTRVHGTRVGRFQAKLVRLKKPLADENGKLHRYNFVLA